MSTPIIAASAAAFGLYVYLKQRSAATAEGSALRASPAAAEAWRHVEHPPNTWTEALYYVKEVCRYMYSETLGRWHTVDLFVGLAYLTHREPLEYPAIDIAYRGRLLSHDQSTEAVQTLLLELKEVHRYLLYCRGLKYSKEDQQLSFWTAHLQLDPAQVLSQSAKAKVLRPAYVLLADTELRCIVLCIRGTQNYQDLFTSLAATSKPHHKVSTNGVVLGFSHLGMLTAARWLLRELARDICLAMKMHPGYKLRVVGHSMGAGTAALLTTMLREGVPECADAKCYALACPACMTLELAQSCKDYVTSIVHGTDIVPTFSAASVDALREDVMHSSWFVEFQRDLRTSIFRTVQDGWRGMGSATQWTARNILQPPFRSCYPRGPSASGLAASSTVPLPALVTASAANLVATAATTEAVFTSGSEQDLPSSVPARLHGHSAEWPQAGQAWRISGNGGDTRLPANHIGGSLSTQQLRRRLWPWGTGRERDGDGDSIGVGYEAAASMSYGGWLPDSEELPASGSGGPTERRASGELAERRAHLQRASSDGGQVGATHGAGAAASGPADAFEESPSKRKSWNALQGFSRWWQQRMSTAGGSGMQVVSGATNTGIPVHGKSAAGAPASDSGHSSVPESSSRGSDGEQALEPELNSAASGPGAAAAGVATIAPPGGPNAAAWLLRGMFNACTTRRPDAQAQGQMLVSADSDRPTDQGNGQQTGVAGLRRLSMLGAQDTDMSADHPAGSGAGDELLGDGDEFQAREVQEDITAVVAAMAGEGADAEVRSERQDGDDDDGDMGTSLTAEEEEALLRELNGDIASPSGADSLLTSPVRVGQGRPPLPSGNGAARKAQRVSGPGSAHGPGQRAAASVGQDEGGSTPDLQGSLAAGSTGPGVGVVAPIRHMYPPGRILHLLPAARISGPTGPLPSSSAPPRSQLGAPPPGGVSAAALAENISRNTPTPPGIRPGTAEVTSSRVAFYETPHVLLEVPDNQAYSRIKLCRTMVLDHLMPAYLTALGSVVQQLEAQVQQHGAPTSTSPPAMIASVVTAAPLAAQSEQLGAMSAASAPVVMPDHSKPLPAESARADSDSSLLPQQPAASHTQSAPSLPHLPPPASKAAVAADKKGLAQAAHDVYMARRQTGGATAAEPLLLGPSVTGGTVHLRNTARQRPIFSVDGDLL